jgi:hypothetical protein
VGVCDDCHHCMVAIGHGFDAFDEIGVSRKHTRFLKKSTNVVLPSEVIGL